MQRFPKLLFSSMRLALAALALCLLFGLAGSVNAAESWILLGDAGFTGGFADRPSLVFDSTGTPYVAYRDGTQSDRASVMQFDGSNWELLGDPGFSYGAALGLSAAIYNDMPVVAYADTARNDRAVVIWRQGDWEWLGNPHGVSEGPVSGTSLAVDTNGELYLAFSDSDLDDKATVLLWNGSDSWDPVGYAGFSADYADDISLAIYGTMPYVAYTDGGNDDKATVMAFTGGSWQVVGTAGFSADYAEYLSLAFDNTGTPYVAYMDGGNANKATVMKFTGGAWQVVGAAGFSSSYAEYTSLAFDGATPYVAFRDNGSGKATVMKFDGANWVEVGAPQFSSGVVADVSLVINNGNPHVVFQDGGSNGPATVMRFAGDAPIVTSFGATTPSNSIDIPITSFTASGDEGVTGYLITEDATPPEADSLGWSATAPTIFTVASGGNYTLYPWAKDDAGQVSAVYGSPAAVTVNTATVTVTSNADSGADTLRGKIATANPGEIIRFDADMTIELNSPLVVDKNLKIDGTGRSITLDGQNVTQALQVNSGVKATLDTLTIRNGKTIGDGGGVLNEGNLKVNNSTFTFNQADYSGAIANSWDARLTVTGSTFSSNSANISGGAIYNWYGDVDITNTTFSSNSANSGGAIFNDTNRTLRVTDSALENNTADDSDGGAIYNLAGTMILTRSTVQGNTAVLNGGGIKNEKNLNITDSTIKDNSAGRGAGIFNLDAHAWMTGSSVNTNIAYYDGGGIYSEGGTVEMTSNSAVNGNTATTGDGGGIFVTGAAGLLKLTGTTLNLNTAGRDGGGAHVGTDSTFEITDSSLKDNQAARDGGGLRCYAAGGMTRATLSGNSAGQNGGGAVFSGAGASFIAESTVSNNTATLDGGGISIEAGTFDISGSVFRGNAASGYGGGIKNDTAATLNALADTWEDNQANNDGGAIYNKGTLSISTSSVNNNTSSYRGGGIASNGGTTRLAATAMSGNVARLDGGAIAIQGGSASAITNSTVSGNTAGEDGGEGGGIYTDHTGTLEIANVTLSGNTAPANSGGGLSHRNIADSGSILNLKNTIIANSPTGGDCKSTGTVTGKNNLIKDTGADACNLTDGANGNLIGREPRLTPLASYGGPTKTHKLENDSPAIDAGDQTTCDDAATVNKRDQRSQSRDDLQCDIGGFELTSSDSSAVQLTPQTGQMRTFGPTRAGIKSDGLHPGVVNIIRQTIPSGGNNLSRSLNIIADTFTGLDLTLKMCYSSAELGSLNENNLKFWSRTGNGSWSDEGAPTFSGTSPNRCAERSGITHLSEWTLGMGAPTATDAVSVRGAVNSKGHAVVRWESVNELQIVGYNVYRKFRVKQGQGDGKAEWKQLNVNLIQAKQVGMVQGAKYRFTDKKVKAGKTYRYKIQVLYSDNHSTWTNVVRVKTP